MTMKGYKIAFHGERINSKDAFTGLHYEATIMKIPVLVELDIPDNAETSTPENRYTEKNMNELFRPFLNLCFECRMREPMSPWQRVALENFAAYLTYKDEDPLTIYNKFLNNYYPGLSEYIHSVKCRCDKAMVVDIVGIFNGMHYRYARSLYAPDFTYELYGTVRCDNFDTCEHIAVCASGIHYFEYPVFAMSYMLEEMDELIDVVRDGKINAKVAEKYLTEELNTLRSDIDERT